jgi:hypothetical protein
MLSGAFLGVAIQQKADKWGLLRGCLVGPIAILFPILYSRAYAPARASSVSFGTDFVQKYTHLKSLINYGQIKPIFLTPGPVLFAAGILAFVYVAIRYRAYWRLAALGFLWVAPATVWWLTVNGNSARHNMSPLIGLAFFIGLAIFGNGKARLWKYGVLCALIVANYFSWPNSDMTWLPSTRLLSSAWLTQDRTTFVGQRALDFVYADGDKKMVIGEGSGVVAAMACLGAAKKIDYTSDRYNFALTMPWAITPRRQAIDMIKVTSPQEATIKMNYMKAHGVKNFFSLEYMLDQ